MSPAFAHVAGTLGGDGAEGGEREHGIFFADMVHDGSYLFCASTGLDSHHLGLGRSRIEIFSWLMASQSEGGKGGGGAAGGAGGVIGEGVAGGAVSQTVSLELSEHDQSESSPPFHRHVW
eukprot:scaffold88407_cov66-Phaeocystis_antarctica.AAC.3